MNWTLEAVVVRVSDVGVAKAFYAERIDFNADHDIDPCGGRTQVRPHPPPAAASA